MAQRVITIGQKDIIAEEKELLQAELLFYSENPRIYTILKELGDSPSQSAIERKMIVQNHVKTLKDSIKANGGLLEPIIVKGGVVLEGNSRLAAYRILAKEDPIRWGMIKCNVLPDDTSADTITALLGTLHVIGKTPWSPYEQAGFLVRRVESSRKPIDALALELGIKQTQAKLYIEVYQAMMKANDMNPTKWSYYYELLKSKDLKKYDENNPTLNFLDTVMEQIKDDTIYQAKDIRNYVTLVKTKSENADEAITDVLSGELTLDEAVELVGEDTKLAAISAKAQNFYKYIVKEESNIKANAQDTALNFELRRIYSAIKSALNLE